MLLFVILFVIIRCYLITLYLLLFVIISYNYRIAIIYLFVINYIYLIQLINYSNKHINEVLKCYQHSSLIGITCQVIIAW